ncbi:hypothetical protein QTL86_09145 [Cellulosilyticum sp. ST5]|uniref:XkdQ/YqbQ family protein n=1 Tax=Cellulosilyticum sp. ST5 TaxID=3055805 RepID=UPI0039778FDE
MPKVVLKNKTATIDVTNMTSTIKWSGSISQIARVLELDFLYPLHDHFAPKIYPNIGDKMYLYDDTGEELFRGRVFYNERFGEQGTIQITCYDDAIRLSKSKGTYNFKNKTAEAITRTICNDLGISIGKLASTGIPQKMLCSNMGMYEIIKSAYESASMQNKKKYYIIMKQGKLNVEEVGKEVLDYILKADSNILESTYSENAEGVVNKVKIYDENDQYLGVVQNDELISLVGVFQEIYIKEEDKQARTVARSMLQGIAREAQVTVKGNTSCLSGKVIKVEDSLTKIVGSFYIESDEHEWSGGKYVLRVNLKYKR